MIIKSESTPVIWTVIIRLRLVFKTSEPTPNLKWIFVKWFWISTPDSNNTVPVTFQLLYLKSSLRVYSQGQDTTWSRPFQNSEPGGPERWTDDENKSRLGHPPKPILFNSSGPGSALTYRAQIEPVVFMNYPITWFDWIWQNDRHLEKSVIWVSDTVCSLARLLCIIFYYKLDYHKKW